MPIGPAKIGPRGIPGIPGERGGQVSVTTLLCGISAHRVSECNCPPITPSNWPQHRHSSDTGGLSLNIMHYMEHLGTST